MSNRMGRPSKLEPEKKEILLRAIGNGAHLDVACQVAGINENTFYHWRRRGEGRIPDRNATKEYVQFAQEVNEAIATAEMALVSTVAIASNKDWKAAAWMLSRRYPSRWAQTQTIKVQAEQQVDAELNLFFESIMDDDTIPTDIKLRLVEHATNLGDRAAVAGAN